MLLAILSLLGEICLLAGQICVLVLMFGLLLMIFFLIYCVLLGWLSVFPMFSGYFWFMCNVWNVGLVIVTKTWKAATIGAVVLFVLAHFY